MKCGACGYEYRRESRWVDDVKRYKSGSRKGEVKDISKKEITFNVGDEEFLELDFTRAIEELAYKLDWETYVVSLYMCPKCKTIRGG